MSFRESVLIPKETFERLTLTTRLTHDDDAIHCQKSTSAPVASTTRMEIELMDRGRDGRGSVRVSPAGGTDHSEERAGPTPSATNRAESAILNYFVDTENRAPIYRVVRDLRARPDDEISWDERTFEMIIGGDRYHGSSLIDILTALFIPGKISGRDGDRAWPSGLVETIEILKRIRSVDEFEKIRDVYGIKLEDHDYKNLLGEREKKLEGELEKLKEIDRHRELEKAKEEERTRRIMQETLLELDEEEKRQAAQRRLAASEVMKPRYNRRETIYVLDDPSRVSDERRSEAGVKKKTPKSIDSAFREEMERDWTENKRTSVFKVDLKSMDKWNKQAGREFKNKFRDKKDKYGIEVATEWARKKRREHLQEQWDKHKKIDTGEVVGGEEEEEEDEGKKTLGAIEEEAEGDGGEDDEDLKEAAAVGGEEYDDSYSENENEKENEGDDEEEAAITDAEKKTGSGHGTVSLSQLLKAGVRKKRKESLWEKIQGAKRSKKSS